MSIDEWFAGIREKYSAQMQCGKGCTACCHGLFDISLADVARMTLGFQQLPQHVQDEVRVKAVALHASIRESAPQESTPTLFNPDDPRIDNIVDGAGSPPCPFLATDGRCLIYEHRPMACRLEGVPMVDVRDGLFGDWCELNFLDGVNAQAKTDLAQDYDKLSSDDEGLSLAIARRAGLPESGLVTFIPCAVIEHDNFWKRLL